MILTADDLLTACRNANLTWGQAAWLADLPPDVGPDELPDDARRRVTSAVADSLPHISAHVLAEEWRGMCNPLEIGPDQEGHNRRWADRERRRKALWLVAVEQSRRATSGPGLFDTGEEEDPKDVVRRAWGEWRSLAEDTAAYELAWCIGAFRLLGIRVESKDGKPNILAGGRPKDVTDPLLAVLRRHRPQVVERIAAGLPFDSVGWQTELILKAAGGWPVWGYRLGGVTADCTRESLLPVLPDDLPPFYDCVQVYRPDCLRSIPAEAMLAVRADHEVGRRLAAGMVYLGPATADVPEGKGGVLAEERKVRKQNGYTHNPILV